MKCLVVKGRLEHGGGIRASEGSLTPFCGISLTHPQVAPGLFGFILSFPLLKDLGLMGFNDPQLSRSRPRAPDEPHTVIPSTSALLTGSLDFHLLGGAGGVARQLDLPNGLRFRKLALSRKHKTDLLWITELVVREADDVAEYLL